MSEHTKGPWQVEDGFSVVGTRRTVTEYFVRRDGDSIAIAADILDPKTGEPSEANARLIAAAPQLLEACEAVNRLVEILDRKIRLVSQRRGGSFGIAVDESPIGREWQALDAEERAIRCSVDAAIRAAREG